MSIDPKFVELTADVAEIIKVGFVVGTVVFGGRRRGGQIYRKNETAGTLQLLFIRPIAALDGKPRATCLRVETCAQQVQTSHEFEQQIAF